MCLMSMRSTKGAALEEYRLQPEDFQLPLGQKKCPLSRRKGKKLFFSSVLSGDQSAVPDRLQVGNEVACLMIVSFAFSNSLSPVVDSLCHYTYRDLETIDSENST